MADIYALCCPISGEPRYIGKANNARKRLSTHLQAAGRLDNPVHRWIRKLRAAGLSPKLVVLESAEDWRTAERNAIAWYRLHGASLLNVADGGDEPHCPLEVRTANARQLNAALAADPLAKRIRDAKRDLGAALHRGQLSAFAKDCMRECARKAPHLFGAWSSV